MWVVGAGDTVSKRAVTTRDAGPTLVEIADGLKPGERIVVEGGSALEEGAKIQ